MKTAAQSQQAPMTVNLPQALTASVEKCLESWKASARVSALWQKDSTVWTGKDEAKWLDWLGLPVSELEKVDQYEKFAQEIKSSGFTDVLLLGMGGSSLAPEVFSVTYGPAAGYPRLHILDSTDPQQIAHVQAGLETKKTLFVVASKSGSTLEPSIFMKHFLERAKGELGDNFGAHFVAITDPGSKLEAEARALNFRNIFHGLPGVGGRYSALSPFGVVPMCLLGMDVRQFLQIAADMAEACKLAGADNPGLHLGAVMGEANLVGRDKLTIFTSPSIYDFGAWLEQLVAESTGKVGKAIIPVDQELPGAMELYGKDRLFVFVKLAGDKTDHGLQNEEVEKFLSTAEAAGHPVITITLKDKLHLAGEFFRFEMATAVAGAVMGIKPFDRPDVEASKIGTRELTDAYAKTGKLPAEESFFTAGQIELYSSVENAEAITGGAKQQTLSGMLASHLQRLNSGDYFALLAYLFMDHKEIESTLFKLRMAVRDKKQVATCLGFGPRFLHSTGQAYKGGPNSGVFLQVTADDAEDLPVPGARYTFGAVKAAQARGDFRVLLDRKRRALRVHIKGDLKTGLESLKTAMLEALS